MGKAYIYDKVLDHYSVEQQTPLIIVGIVSKWLAILGPLMLAQLVLFRIITLLGVVWLITGCTQESFPSALIFWSMRPCMFLFWQWKKAFFHFSPKKRERYWSAIDASAQQEVDLHDRYLGRRSWYHWWKWYIYPNPRYCKWGHDF